VAILKVLNNFDFYDAVPVDGSATYAEIAARTRLPEGMVRRLLRHAMLSHWFAPAPKDFENSVVHTAVTAHVVRNPEFRGAFWHFLDESVPSSLKLSDALKRWAVDQKDMPQNTRDTAFGLHIAGPDGSLPPPFFEFVATDGEGEQKGFRKVHNVNMLKALGSINISRLDEVIERFDWSSLGKAKVVDVCSPQPGWVAPMLTERIQVGGSTGSDAKTLAAKYPHISIVVEDLPEVEEEYDKNMPTELASRMQFRAHNFFMPQPIEADIFMLKMILHDYPDVLAIQILRQLIPGMRPGTRILIVEAASPPQFTETGSRVLPTPIEKVITGADFTMASMLNSKERFLSDWVELLAEADSRFHLDNMHITAGNWFGMFEVIWKP
jgi:hypothetical protein